MTDTREQIRMRLWVDEFQRWLPGCGKEKADAALEAFDAKFPEKEESNPMGIMKLLSEMIEMCRKDLEACPAGNCMYDFLKGRFDQSKYALDIV